VKHFLDWKHHQVHEGVMFVVGLGEIPKPFGMSLVVRRTHQSDKQTETTEVSAVMVERQNCERSVECGVLGTQAVTFIRHDSGLRNRNY
jgi:hypothetical protein